MLFTSSNSSLRELEWDKLLQYYHEELVFVLKKLEYSKPLPTLRSIRNQFANSGLYTALVGIMLQNTCTNVLEPEVFEGEFLPLFLFPSTSDEDRKTRAKILSNPKAAITTKHLLEYYDRKGYLN